MTTAMLSITNDGVYYMLALIVLVGIMTTILLVTERHEVAFESMAAQSDNLDDETVGRTNIVDFTKFRHTTIINQPVAPYDWAKEPEEQ